MKSNKIKPSIAWYFVSGGILLIGIIAVVIIIINGIIKTSNNTMEPFVIPGNKIIHLEEGNYNVYHEYRSVIDNTYYECYENLNGLYCKITKVGSQEEIAVRQASINSTYSVNNREGYSIFSFTVEEEGNYFIEVGFDEGFESVNTVFAIGKGFSKYIILTIFASMGVGLVSFTLALVIFILTLLKRKQAKDKLLYNAHLHNNYHYKTPQ